MVTAAPRRAGRKSELRPTPVAQAAADRGIAILAPPRLRDADTLATLRAADAVLMVLADYGHIVPAEVLEMPPHGALNLHPSLLPRHRGASPVPATILAGDEVTGVTLMRMDEGLDTGPIVAQTELALQGDEVAPSLEARLAEMGAELLDVSLRAWLAGSLVARPQPTDGATLTKRLRRGDGLIDPDRPAAELERQIRAYQPWPGSFLEIDGERLIVWGAELADGDGSAPLGSLVAHDETVALVTAVGLLRLTEVQPAGGRRMSGADYRRGKRL